MTTALVRKQFENATLPVPAEKAKDSQLLLVCAYFGLSNIFN